MKHYKIVANFEVEAESPVHALKLMREYLKAHEQIDFENTTDEEQEAKFSLDFDCEGNLKILQKEASQLH